MKKTIILVLLFFITVNTIAQFEYNSEEKIIPFSLSDKYKNLLDTSKVNTCMLPSYNNDSLYWEANFEAMYIKKNYRSIKAGFPIDTIINIKTTATKYELTEGTLWLYKIESETSEGLSITFKKFDVPNGALLCIYSQDTSKSEYNLGVYTKKEWDNLHPQTKFWHYVVGNTLFIEYFEPKNSISNTPIFISSISYIYEANKKKWIKNAPESLKKKYPNFDFE